jgi:predicted homoserine dehydrogenase-like protein
MIIIDKALEKLEAKNRYIRVGLIGHGYIGRGIEAQLAHTPGMKLISIGNRNNWWEVCRNPNIDVIVDATGDVEFGTHVAINTIHNDKHLVLMNAELDATIGPILKAYADEAGVIYTASDGDQPGVTMNLYRQVKGLGFHPVLCGNIKGFQDVHSNPVTVAEFARRTNQKPGMITSFADGTKISIEQAIVANGTGMHVSVRGMYGPKVPPFEPIERAVDWYPVNGYDCVDYVIGASPAPGVFVIAENWDAESRKYLEYYKMGPGPKYVFYTPYHLCHFEVHNSVARAVLFNDATLAPIDSPMVDVISVTKTDLKKGDVLDGIGGFHLYGQCENSPIVAKENLLPIGLAKNCELKRDVPRDTYLTYDDVVVPSGRLSDQLRGEQNDRWRK